mgnify:CR=1 FL=1
MHLDFRQKTMQLKNKIHPKIVTENNVKHFKDQLHSLGYSFDWDREINTTDPKYYKWTQWIFLKLFKAGLAYKKEMPINWCTSCKVGLANEEVVNGVCERCGAPVVRKVKSEWMLKITDYADKLIEGLNDVDYIERVKVSQKNWIGRSTGAEVDFQIKDTEDKLRIYTTRCDTLFGVTYMVVSPEHPYLDKYKDQIKNWEEIVAYREQASRKSDFERAELAKDKTGVAIDGLTAINPVNGKEVPIWVSDYVLMSYGTGAIMAVPAHDERDWEFAKKFHLPIIQVVAKNGEEVDVNEAAFTDVATGVLINSDFLNGLEVKDAKEKMIKFLEEKGIGQAKTNYKLRDWVFSRQRYWGEPIPIVHCDKCGYVPIDESELPLLLPEVESYMPTDNGESPLAAMTDWVNTTCPCCGGPAKRETDTMPQWAGSSWYFLRYTDPHNDKALASPEALKYWLPVDWYNGGMEHTTLHLLYSRFWHKFLYDQGVVPTPEPYQKRTSHGMILGENGEKMSKSRGNVVNPDDIVQEYGADTLRTYEMFIGAFDDIWIKVLCAALVMKIVISVIGVFVPALAGENDVVEIISIVLAIALATGFSTLSEYRNSSRSEALQEEYNKTYAKVMRNGKLVNILTSEIVKGDTILVQAGDKVPTDGVLFEGHIKVSQAALNGESRDENKTAADNLDEAESTDYASANKVFMGSVVTSGEGYMVATVIGDASELGKINKALTDDNEEDERKDTSSLKLEVVAAGIGKLGVSAAAIAGVLDVVLNLIRTDEPITVVYVLLLVAEAVMLMASIVIMAVPEGLPMMNSLVQSMNTESMYKKNILVSHKAAFSDSAYMNVLFSDKTGTITQGNLSLVEIYHR